MATLAKSIAIVSGGATGIGAACAEMLARSGFCVAINYRQSTASAEQTVARCRQTGAQAIAVQGDVANDDDCRQIVEQTVGEWGAVDVLVNNAGVTLFADASDLEALVTQDFERIMAVNVTGAYQMTRAAAPYLQNSKNAAVVNISSHSAFSGIGSSMAYAASKGALNTLTLSLARALAPAIRVNAVCPGFVDTNWMAKKLDAEKLATFKQRAAAISPLRRLVSAEDVADAVCWLATHARAITGQFLVIDSGTHLTLGNPL